MRRYAIKSVQQLVPLTGKVAGTVWAQAAAAQINNFLWYQSGLKQGTTVRMLYDIGNLYVQFRCQDRHSFAVTTDLNGPVWQDSCVELFVAPDPRRSDYVNTEINCCGILLMGFGPLSPPRPKITPALAERVAVVSSLPGPTKEESPCDRTWWIAARIPFDVLSELLGLAVSAKPGQRWRGNFYRLGGKTDSQFACWAPIDADTPDFHRPEFFGELRFL